MRYNTRSDTITLKGIIDEDFVNYRVPSMTLMFPYCDFKCEKESGKLLCHNSGLAKEKNITIPISKIYERYINNPISKAIILQGLEPMDSWIELNSLIFYFRIHEGCFDDIVIYTGYDKDEISDEVDYIKKMYSNVIIKFGRYIPDQKPHYDDVLGINLASDNQYAERITL